MRGSRLSLRVVTWDGVRALLKQHSYTGPAVLHCAEGEPKMLEIPAEPVVGQLYRINDGVLDLTGKPPLPFKSEVRML